MKTKQEILDHVMKHARTQKVPAMTTEAPACRYRLEVGGVMLKCFVGCLIRDEDYTDDMEACSVTSQSREADRVREALNKNDISTDDATLEFLGQLQCIHDGADISLSLVDKWEARFADVARKHGLVYTESDESLCT